MEYNSNNWKEAVIEIDPSGRAPKKYGDNVYRFAASLTLSVIMPRRGWDLVKKTKNYVYLKPPGNLGSLPFQISINIPSRAQATEIANLCFKNAESWAGQIGEWPAWYIHESPQETYEILPNKDRSEITKKLIDVDHPISTLHIGEFGVWSVDLTKTNSDFNFHEHGCIKGVFPIEQSLFEGLEFNIEQTKFERNVTARKKCIDHHGIACQVCNMNFTDVYGDIGNGFIHIHHLNPISQKEGEYEIDPIRDLVPLCPNCHAMIHRRNPPYSVDELRHLYHSNGE